MARPRYFPFMHGVYDVKAGIAALSKDLGNGPVDAHVFQIDDQFDAYQAAKRDAMRAAGRHVLRQALPDKTEHAIARWMAQRLIAAYPARFAGLSEGPETLDALALQVQEDLAVLVIDEGGRNRVAYLHVSMPSGWAPEEKIGRPFDAVHAPVPHIEPINAKQDAIARLMVKATHGAVRFAWTVTTDAALNHHPLRDRAAPQPTPLPDHPEGQPLLRVERQVIWGFPAEQAAVFTIRTYLYRFEELGAPARAALAAAVAGMSEQSLLYKDMDRGLILDRLGGVSVDG